MKKNHQDILNHSRSTALERSVKLLLGWGEGAGAGGLNSFYIATTLALSFAVVYKSFVMGF